MKTIINIVFIALITVSCSAREKNFRTFYRNHKSDDGVLNLNIPPQLARIFIPDEEILIKDFLKETSSLRLLIKQESDTELASELSSMLSSSDYKDLIFVKDGSEFVRICAKMNKDKIQEIIITVNDSDNFVAVQLKGNYSMATLKKLSQKELG